MRKEKPWFVWGLSLLVPVFGLQAQEGESGVSGSSAAELAKKLANPVASLISVPFQFNYEGDIGAADKGERVTLNIQPVAPFALNENWNVISRTVLPFVDQSDIFEGAGSQSGIGDVVQSFFFSPVKPTSSGWIWGVGPVALVPTGSNDLLTTDKWGIGPTVVALKQRGQWTTGFLANHIASFAGEDDRADVNTTLLQPFATYTTPGAVSIAIQTEATYDWESEEWSVPLALVVSKVFNIGGQMVNIGVGGKYYAESTDGGPEGFGVRLVATFLFPK